MQHWMLLHSIETLCGIGYDAYLQFVHDDEDNNNDKSSSLQTFLRGSCVSPWESVSEVMVVVHSESLLLDIANVCKRIMISEQLQPVLNKGNIATVELHIWYSASFSPMPFMNTCI